MNVFVACGARKASSRCKAKDMYIDKIYGKSMEYAEFLKPDRLYILSAKHHLLNPNKEIDPYNLYLGDLSAEKRKEWAEEVYKEMKSHHIDFNAKTYFMAGEDYIEYLRDYFPNRVEVFHGKRFGELMRYMNNKMNKSTKNESLISLENYIKESLKMDE